MLCFVRAVALFGGGQLHFFGMFVRANALVWYVLHWWTACYRYLAKVRKSVVYIKTWQFFFHLYLSHHKVNTNA